MSQFVGCDRFASRRVRQPGRGASALFPAIRGFVLAGVAISASQAFAQCGVPLFSPAVTSATAAPCRSIAVADFNGDGRQDIAVVSNAASSVAIQIGNGLGSFTVAGQYVQNSAWAIATGDLNGDKKVDLVVSLATTNSVGVMLGNGSGAFAAGISVPVGSGPRGIALADVNGDGKLDLITANSTALSFSVCNGNGLGGFGTQVQYSVGGPINDIALGDLNGDGRPDLVYTINSGGGIGVRLNNGSGVFSVTSQNMAGVGGTGVRLADLDRDGRLDLVAFSPAASAFFVARGLGNGTFGLVSAYSIVNATNGWQFGVGDLDGDGVPDLAFPRSGVNSIAMYKGAGNTSFAASTSVGVGASPLAAVIADFNNDSKGDLLSVSSTANTASCALNTSLTPTSIAINPSPASTCRGGSAVFGVMAAGTSLTYQWRLNGSPISTIANPSAATNTLTVSNAGAADAGSYTCVVTGTCGSATSVAAALGVCMADSNCDGFVDFTDFDSFATSFENGSAAGDFNGDGFVDFTDFDAFVTAFEAGC